MPNHERSAHLRDAVRRRRHDGGPPASHPGIVPSNCGATLFRSRTKDHNCAVSGAPSARPSPPRTSPLGHFRNHRIPLRDRTLPLCVAHPPVQISSSKLACTRRSIRDEREREYQCFLHSLILPSPTQTRNSGRAEQCWVWLGATEGLGASCRWEDAPRSTRGTSVGPRLFVRESSDLRGCLGSSGCPSSRDRRWLNV